MNKTILVVDDEPANIDLIKGILPDDIKVKAALKGEVAIKLVGKTAPDMIFLDLIMPGMDGFETLRNLRELPGGDQLKVVIVSGNNSHEDIEKGKNLGAIAHLQKPIDSDLLSPILSNYL